MYCEFTDDGETQTVKETVTVKKTYRQEWTAYNQAQTLEKDQFQLLLRELCKGLGEPSQKNGRPRLPFDEMVRLDLFYIENWSLLLDLKIILRTLPVMLRGDDAY